MRANLLLIFPRHVFHSMRGLTNTLSGQNSIHLNSNKTKVDLNEDMGQIYSFVHAYKVASVKDYLNKKKILDDLMSSSSTDELSLLMA